MSEYTLEIVLICNIILFACVLGLAYVNWTAQRERQDSWKSVERNHTEYDAEKDRLQAKVDKLTEELAEARKVLDDKDEEFVLIRQPYLVECKYESPSSCRHGVYRFTVEVVDPKEDAERLTKVLRSGKILIKGAGKE